MNIQLSFLNSAEQILKIFKDCKERMESENIFQWTESYPNLEIIIKDINNKHLYELSSKGEIFGVISLNTYQEAEYDFIDWFDENGKALIIHRLAINPLFQNKGFGKKMMVFAEEFALNHGFTSIRFDAYSGNEKSLKFYEKMDYQKRGQVNFPGRDLPFFCYEKSISE